MGQTESLQDDEFVIVSNTLPGCFQFDPAESWVISYGVDKQTSPQFRHKSLGPTTVKDAQQILQAFVDAEVVPSTQARLYSASMNPENCTTAGMKKAFQEHVSKVGQNGLFVFHFTGHGISVQDEQWGLAPMDFDYTSDTYITADVLSQWMNEAESRAKYILITLDCCYAGGIGKQLAAQADTNRATDLYIMSACTANETSLVLASLGHSIFSYFLSDVIIRFQKDAGVFSVREIYNECLVCCECLASLLVSYSKERGLQMKPMQPQISVRNITESTDSSTIGRFQFVSKLYNINLPLQPLHDKSLAYLDTIRAVPDGPLFQLQKRKLLDRRPLMESVICCIMYSMASIELACDDGLTKVRNINLAITAFVQAVSAVDMIHHDVEVDGYLFYLSWLFYKEVMSKNKIKIPNSDEMEARVRKLHLPQVRRTSSVASSLSRGEDLTDSSEMETVVSLKALNEFLNSSFFTYSQTQVEVFQSAKQWLPLLP